VRVVGKKKRKGNEFGVRKLENCSRLITRVYDNSSAHSEESSERSKHTARRNIAVEKQISTEPAVAREKSLFFRY
jgi:hypothetical protein